MHEPDLGDRIIEYLGTFKSREGPMTPDERKDIGMLLGKKILLFFNDYPDLINQETVEILGIAMMYYSSYLYHAGLSSKEEKP